MKDIISQSLAESMETASWIHESLADNIVSASELAVEKLAQSGRLYFASCSNSQPLIQITIEKLMRRKLHIRPPLPAWSAAEIAVDQNGNVYSDSLESALLQLRATCSSQDCVFFVLENASFETISVLDDFSREIGVPVVSLANVDQYHNEEQPHFTESSTQRHLSIQLNLSSIARKQEAILFILNCLSDMIEASLFGQTLE